MRLETQFVKHHWRPKDEFGRISKQEPAGKGESSGWNPQNRDFWKAKVNAQRKEGRGYSLLQYSQAEATHTKREAAYLINNPSHNPGKAKWNADVRAAQRSHDANRGKKQ